MGAWILNSFKKNGENGNVNGQLVVTEDEVTPVMTKLQEGGVDQTALHNHVLHESPRVMYMHIGATGDAVKLAKAIHDALALRKTPLSAPAAGRDPNQDIGIGTKQLDQILGQAGKAYSGGLHFRVPTSQ